MPIDTYDMAITLALHASEFIEADDEGGYEINIARLKALLKQLLDLSDVYDDKA